MKKNSSHGVLEATKLDSNLQGHNTVSVKEKRVQLNKILRSGNKRFDWESSKKVP